MTEHFTLEELTRTSVRGVLNLPTERQILAFTCLCSAVLEPLRERVGRWKITSGFRTQQVNRAWNGHPNSHHLALDDCAAADGRPLDTTLLFAWQSVVAMTACRFPIHEAIIYQRPEGEGWIHLAHRVKRSNDRELLVQPMDRPKVYIPWREWTGDLVL